jgi:ATP-dependent RNA helicase DeaD
VLRFIEAQGAMLFCSTREAVRQLHSRLVERGFAAVALSGELSQSERTHALQALRDGRARVCVATDVAARGIDLPDLGLVVHADLPRNREALLHRSGRTGRAGRKGICVLLVPYTQRRRAEMLLAAARVDAAWSGPPGAEEIRARDQERLLAEVAAAEEPAGEELAVAQALLAQRSAEEIAVALLRLHRARLPAPEELLDGPAGTPLPGPAVGHPDRVPGDSVWFRMNLGRNRNADPRWLVPLICRRGHVTKREIGAIRIGDRETRFEIARAAADRFAAAVRRPDPEGEGVRIEPATSRGDRPRPAATTRGAHHRPSAAGRPGQLRPR